MLFIIALLIIDQVAKILTKVFLQPVSIFNIIPGIISFRYVENNGVAFGMMSGKQIFIIIITVAVICIFLYDYLKHVRYSKNILQKMSYILIIAGAFGNLIDRVFRGYVVDFINFDFVNFAVFNIADIYICIGCALLVIYILFFSKKE